MSKLDHVIHHNILLLPYDVMGLRKST